MTMRSLFLLFFIPLALCGKPPLKQFQGDLRVYFKDPVYEENRFYTDQGGIVSIGDLRIQAQKIMIEQEVIEGVHCAKLIAEGDLLLVVKKRFLKARRFEFNFNAQEGYLFDPVIMIGPMFFSAKAMKLSPHRTLTATGLEVTTAIDEYPEWKIKVHKGSIKNGRELSAQNMTVTWEEIPIFWMPYLRFNANFLRKQKESPSKYKFNWTSGQDPMVSFRYALFSTDELSVYGRVDLRVKRGIGGAIETDFLRDKLAFYTKNYIAHDTFYNDTDPNKKKTRFRFQGQLKTDPEHRPFSLLIQYDKISDRNLRADFRQDQFELATFQRTEAIARLESEHAISELHVRPRINSFQGFMQELPSIAILTHPYGLANGYIVHTSQNRFSYLDYIYAKDISETIPAFKAGRFSTEQHLSSSFYLGPLHLVPKLTGEIIGYTNSPSNSGSFQAICRYGCDANIGIKGSFCSLAHKMEPYLSFEGITRPTSSIQNVFIFGIDDGINRLNQIRFGLKNFFFAPRSERSLIPRVGIDIYGIHFFGSTPFSVAVPKLFFEGILSYPRFTLSANIEWNFQNHTLNHALVRLLWTIQNDAAINLEYYHRGRYDWRVIDPLNFIMEVSRPIDLLLQSPLSDHRDTVVGRLILPVTRQIDMRLSAHLGYGYVGGWAQTGGTQKFYDEEQIDFFIKLASTWKARVTYTRTVRDSQFSFGINLIPRG